MNARAAPRAAFRPPSVAKWGLRQQSLRDELSQTRRLQQDEESALHKKISGLEAEKANVLHQLLSQRARIELAEAAVKRASQLLAQGYYSAEMTQQKQADLLDQRNRLGALERDQISVTRELHNQKSELTSLPLRQHNQMAQIERLRMNTDQECLFAGSIADNISFFDPCADHAWIAQCAELAAISADIASMPMGYNTLVGDMGTVLSGGQKQRVLLARAVYKRPRILFLDEATSHLDISKEQQVNLAIKGLNMTRIIIAHRPETIASASRVIILMGGKVVQDVSVSMSGTPAADCDSTLLEQMP